MMVTTIKEAIEKALNKLDLPDADIVLEHPADPSHGEYSTNVSMILFRQLAIATDSNVGNIARVKVGTKDPRTLATTIVSMLSEQLPKLVERVEVAGPGFINFYLTADFFSEAVARVLKEGASYGTNEHLKGKKVTVEYTDPNPFKEMHAGHVMSNCIGEAIARLYEWSGANVRRVCYQGDVGLHVAKAIWAKRKTPTLSWGDAYVLGSREYDAYKVEIDDLNTTIYVRSDAAVNALWDEGKKESLAAFEAVYKTLGASFDDYFFESDAGSDGKTLVLQHVGDVFEESDGAIVFRAETIDPKLHTRVFVNAAGLPTYEAKELGLAKKKFDVFPYDRSIVVTGNEINEYFNVLLAAMSRIYPDLAERTLHIGHGMLRLPTGKMSSRTGNLITALELIAVVRERVLEKMKDAELSENERIETVRAVAVGAIKYSILKQAIGRDIIFDFDKSLSFDGDSGPYLQYTHARARSVLRKAGTLKSDFKSELLKSDSKMERLLYRFPEVVERAAREHAPHHVVTYLTELASAFNTFYASAQIIGSSDEAYRLRLTEAVATVLKNGLAVLGIEAPHTM